VKISESQVRKIIRQEMSRKRKGNLFEAYPQDPTPTQMDDLRAELAPWGAVLGDGEPDSKTLEAWKKFIYERYEPLTRGTGGVSVVQSPDVPHPMKLYNDWDNACTLVGYPPGVQGMMQFINDGGMPKTGSPAATGLSSNITSLLEQSISAATAVVTPSMTALENLDPGDGAIVHARSAADVVWAWKNIKKVIDEDSTQLMHTRVLIARYAMEHGDFVSPDAKWAEENPGKAALAMAALGFAIPVPGTSTLFAAGSLLGSWWLSLLNSQTTTSIATIMSLMSDPDLATDLQHMSKVVKKGKAGHTIAGQVGSGLDQLFGVGELGPGNPFGQALSTLSLVFQKASTMANYRQANAKGTMDNFLTTIESTHPKAVESFRTGKIVSGALDERKMIRREIDLVIRDLIGESKTDRSRRVIRRDIRSIFSEGTLGLDPSAVDQMARTYRDEEVEVNDTQPTPPNVPPPAPPKPGGGGGGCVQRLQKIVIPSEVDGAWGPNTNKAFFAFIKKKLEEMGESIDGIHQASWSGSGAAKASTLFDPTFGPGPCGAAEFVEHLAGSSTAASTEPDEDVPTGRDITTVKRGGKKHKWNPAESIQFKDIPNFTDGRLIRDKIVRMTLIFDRDIETVTAADIPTARININGLRMSHQDNIAVIKSWLSGKGDAWLDERFNLETD